MLRQVAYRLLYRLLLFRYIIAIQIFHRAIYSISTCSIAQVKAEGYGHINGAVRIVSRKDLPSERCLGLNDESIDRTLAQLCERKVIRRDHDFISIPDSDKLRRLARHRLTE